ncbi:unnamed protein product [Brachionus calyciflorus]|uniref:Uncharacterized protein n=1 Tax=Brachionus calyciflorus TaxID=104777 RepID=A0A813PYV2_9BILA|nr:unnamed protein product [Brachionus calyciflorus]
MYEPNFYNQDDKPAPMIRSVLILSALIFIISLLGISFLIVGLFALVSNSNIEATIVKSSEFTSAENISAGLSLLKIKIPNFGYLQPNLKKKEFMCPNTAIFDLAIQKCNTNITTSQNLTLHVKAENTKFICDKTMKKITLSPILSINSTLVKFDENYMSKIIYSIKVCMSKINGYAFSILSSSQIQISGTVSYRERDNMIEKEYKDCSLEIIHFDNGNKSCVKIRNETIFTASKIKPVFSYNNNRRVSFFDQAPVNNLSNITSESITSTTTNLTFSDLTSTEATIDMDLELKLK